MKAQHPTTGVNESNSLTKEVSIYADRLAKEKNPLKQDRIGKLVAMLAIVNSLPDKSISNRLIQIYGN